LKASFIWFDIGYTLLYMQREVTFQQVLREFGVDLSLEDIEKGFHLTDKFFMREYPGIFLKDREVYMPWYLGKLNYRLGISLNICEFDTRWEEIKKNLDNYWLPFDGVHQALDELKGQSVDLGIISNWDDTAREVLDSANLTGYFEPIIVSSEVGYAKPDPEIFNIALKKAGTGAGDCLYIGDNYYDDALGSRTVGISALIINRFGTLGVEEIENCPIIHHISEAKDHITPEGPDFP